MGVTPITGRRTQQFRIKKEAAYGTAPAAVDNRLVDMRMTPQARRDTEFYAPIGDALPSIAVVNDNYGTFTIDGRLSFSSIIWPLASLFGAPVTTQQAATTAYQHVFTWDGVTLVNPYSYSGHYGDATSARQLTGMIFNSLGFGVSRDGQSMQLTSGGFAKSFTPGVTGGSTPPFAASPTLVAAVPMFPLMFDVYTATTFANLTASPTRYGSMYDLSMSIGERFTRARPINSTQSTDGIAETEGDTSGQNHSMNFTVAADATGEALLTDQAAGTTKFIRIAAVGAANSAGTGFPYSFIMDFAFLLGEPNEYNAIQGVHGLPFTGRIARDSLGNGLKVSVINKIVAGPT